MITHYAIQKISGLDDFFKVTQVREHADGSETETETGIKGVAKYLQKQWLVTQSYDLNSLISRLMRE